ncbi:nitrate- and nitrite sensing domain-containing protein [Nocardia sp. NPDC005366]|uniref:sensor histidine kinase n=1 Tax=Nocardia sp. NPDC005366 TaxID=3156878 RepID=UPI0033A2CF5C
MFVNNFIRGDSARVTESRRSRGTVGVRAQLLAIVLIPSLALLGIGIGATIYLIKDGRKAGEWADLASATTDPARQMVEAFQAERGASILHLAGDRTATATLTVTRKNSDTALAAVQAQGDAASALRPDLSHDIDGYNQLYSQLPVLRSGIDARAVPADQVFTAYSTVIDTIVGATLLAAEVAPDSGVGARLYQAMLLLRASESISRAAVIGAVARVTDRLTPEQLVDLTRYVGDSRAQLATLASALSGQRAAQFEAITAGQDRRQIVAMEDALIRRGVTDAEDMPEGTSAIGWQTAAASVSAALAQLWVDLCRDSQSNATTAGENRAANSAYGGAAILAITALVFIAASFLANRLIGRMRRLRQETLVLAEERLPETIRALSDGRGIDREAVLTPLDFGDDEIGHVADAFNRAHSAAIAAAVAESKTRAGVKAVFLNIAHRSQVMVHRQLALLDRAEHKEEDPSKLDILFQLDHLATRARRNAENLIILGGEQPGRRWRTPVPLIDVVRGAVAESLDYPRIRTGRVPDIRIVGNAVADLIHLIAELTDNATAFSPAETRVDVSGQTVGKGVVLEIADQGLGMSDAEFAERNAMLADPPDFGLATLSSDAHLGLFVIAMLATRHGISVRLGKSDYGGVRAIVLIPTTLVTGGDEGRELTAIPLRTPIRADRTPQRSVPDAGPETSGRTEASEYGYNS